MKGDRRMDDKEIGIDELKNWKLTLEENKNKILKELSEIKECIIRYKIRRDVYLNLASTKKIIIQKPDEFEKENKEIKDREELETKMLKELNKIDALLEQVTLHLNMLYGS